MLEIEYIPLKTPNGATCGHARVCGGYVELKLRSPIRGSALVLTENGSSDAAPGVRIPVSAQVSAIALHENGQLRCCGFSRTSALDAASLRCRLHALAPQPAPAAILPPPRLSDALVTEIASSIPLAPPSAAAPEAPQPVPPSTPEAPAPVFAPEAPDAPSRAAMRARAVRVLTRIQSPETSSSPQINEPSIIDMRNTPPLSAYMPDYEQSHTTPADDWNRETDALLGGEPASLRITNPFPHIFPGAVFTRDEGDALTGVWTHGSSRASISAVPGAYSPQPPASLAGYTRYIRARSGGYWVKVTE